MNLQGTLLFIIGLLVFLIGRLMMIYADRKKTVSTTLWKNEQVNYPHLKQNPSYIFSLQHPSRIKGNVSGTIVPSFYIFEYFDANITPVNLSKPRIFYEVEASQSNKEITPKKEMPPGNYCLFFDCGKIAATASQIQATFSLIEEHDTKPYERWFSVGQTLWEVGIPLLITGLVSLFLIP